MTTIGTSAASVRVKRLYFITFSLPKTPSGLKPIPPGIHKKKYEDEVLSQVVSYPRIK